MAVVIETTIGDITVDLFIDERPQTCKNFLKLCKIKYYNFCLFHSIQANFIAQTGDPTGIGTGGESVYGIVYGEDSKYYEAEKMPKIKHNKPGLLSMVNYGNNMLGSQFFVTLGAELKSLEEHCVFAEVTEGHDILIKLNDAICDNHHRPFQDIRITHTVILEDPFEDLPGLVIPDASPDIASIQTANGRIGADEKVNDEEGLSESQLQEIKADREAKARATILEIIGDIPYAEVAPPENVLFVCKLNPVTTDEDLEVIFGRFGKVKSCEVIRDHQTGDSLQYAFVEFEDQKSCEQAYLKMDNVLIDDRRIHVDFSQSVSKYKWRGKGLGVQYCDKPDEKDNSSRGSDRHSNKRDYYRDRDRDRERDRSERSDRRRGEDDRRRRGTDRDEDYRRRERRKVEEPRRRDEESWREEERWEDDRKRRDPRDERRRDDDRKYSSRRDERRREEDRRRDVEKRRNGMDKKDSSSRRIDNHVEDKKSDSGKNKDSLEKSPKQDPKPECSKHNNGKTEYKAKDQEVLSNINPQPKPKEEPVNNIENKVETEENSVSKFSSNLDVTPNENSTADTITPEKSNLTLKEKKKKRRKMSSSSDSSSTESTESSSSSSSLDMKRKHKRKLTVAKKYYHRGKLVKVIKKKKDDSSDSESSDESSDSDRRRKKRKYKKIVKVIKKRRRTTTDDSDSDSSSSEDSDSSRPRKKKRRNEKIVKKKKKESKRSKKKKKNEPTDSSASEENEKYKKRSKNIEAKKRKEMSD